MGVCTVGLFTGQQQLVQYIGAVDVSTTHSITFTVRNYSLRVINGQTDLNCARSPILKPALTPLHSKDLPLVKLPHASLIYVILKVISHSRQQH